MVRRREDMVFSGLVGAMIAVIEQYTRRQRRQ